MDNRKFAEEIYEFLRDNEASGHLENIPAEDGVAEIEAYLFDLQMVKETIKDIEEISDMFDDHEFYVTDVKPLLRGLREIQGELEAEQNKRMVSDTGYEVKHAINVGDKEILFAENPKAENGMCWFVGDYTQNDIIGQYADCQVSDDFLEAMQEFTDRVNRQIEAMKSEISQSKTPCEVFTAEHCYPNDRGQSIDGKIVAIKADILRPEFRRGDVQIVLVSGGNGARANSHGNAVFCHHLNDGTHTRFERYQVQGEVRPEHLPKWAAEKAAEIQAEKTVRKNQMYVESHHDEFCKDKIYVFPDSKKVQMVYYNPDSDAGGQLVYNDISFDTLKRAFSECKTESAFWEYLDEHGSQTLQDINTPEFEKAAKEFAEKPGDITGCDAKATAMLKKLIIPNRDKQSADKKQKTGIERNDKLWMIKQYALLTAIIESFFPCRTAGILL